MDSGVADSELVTNVTNRGLRLVGVDDHCPLRGREFVFTAAFAPSCSRCGDARLGPRSNSFTFVLCKRGDDL